MSQDANFEKIMELVGNEGRFQNRFNFLYNGLVVFIGAMLARSFIFSMTVPDHWCNVPGREFTNFTLGEWKQFTLPREIDTKGHNSFSKCKMYDVDWETVQWWNDTNQNVPEIQKNLTIKECATYDYDKQWYGSTIASEQNWVCANDMAQTHSYAFNYIGDLFGLFVFGRMGDKYGRRIVFFIGIATTVAGRLIIAFTTSNIYLFRAASLLASVGDTPLYFAPFVIGMEISKPDNRSRVAITRSLFWTFGMSILPFAFWIVREWFIFYIVCSLPLLLFYLIPSQMIESPRWLLTQGKYERAAYYLNQIARVNKKPVVITETLLETMMSNEKIVENDKQHGMLSLFSGWRLAINSIVLIATWMICSASTNTLMLYVQQSDGNPFLNYFGQSMSELPAYFFGVFLVDRLGRRWTSWTSSVGAALLSIPAFFLCTSEDYGYLSNLAVIAVKFFTSVVYFVIGIQATEMYPTYLRQTGFTMCAVGANVAASISPYIAYLGQQFDMRLPILILFVLFVFTCVGSLYLPETLHQTLPDSLEDARLFGKGQKIWSLPRKPPTIEEGT